jgi:hypothetical protein
VNLDTPDAADRMDSVIEHVDGAVAEAVDSVSSTAPTARRMDSVDAPARRRPAILVDLATDGCKYSIDEIMTGDPPRPRFVFCNQSRVPGSPWCVRHKEICLERPALRRDAGSIASPAPVSIQKATNGLWTHTRGATEPMSGFVSTLAFYC